VRLLPPTLIARIPDAIAATAIIVLARSVTGSYSAAGLAAGAFGVGTAASAPLAGRVLDRVGQRRVLPLLAVAFAAALAVLALGSGHLGAGPVIAVARADAVGPHAHRVAQRRQARGEPDHARLGDRVLG
jgi:MFS family permease